LSKFDIKLVHIPGKKNIQADSLFQRPDLCPQGTDNKDVIVLLEHLFVNLIDMELQKKIANAKNMDYDAVMSTPEALPMEIALIALLLSKFQVYLTSLRHYYHRLVTLSTFQLLYQSTIHHMASINTLRLPLKKFFCP
jgi:hypothetical protein